ncbi:uncharacterized protein LOC136033940 [Artemia franciscana]|uniref:uncharacterized protein LOC136033940 n=1 Tax=Artemia franciscana TaxID=6661 RepID=UPI0032D9EB4E
MDFIRKSSKYSSSSNKETKSAEKANEEERRKRIKAWNYEKMKRDLKRSPQDFVLNNLLLSVRFFGRDPRKKKRPSSLEKGINKEHRDIPNSSEITDKDSNFYKEKILKLMTAPQDFILENRVEIYEKDRRISYGTSGDGGNKLKVTMEFDTSSPGFFLLCCEDPNKNTNEEEETTAKPENFKALGADGVTSKTETRHFLRVPLSQKGESKRSSLALSLPEIEIPAFWEECKQSNNIFSGSSSVPRIHPVWKVNTSDNVSYYVNNSSNLANRRVSEQSNSLYHNFSNLIKERKILVVDGKLNTSLQPQTKHYLSSKLYFESCEENRMMKTVRFAQTKTSSKVIPILCPETLKNNFRLGKKVHDTFTGLTTKWPDSKTLELIKKEKYYLQPIGDLMHGRPVVNHENQWEVLTDSADQILVASFNYAQVQILYWSYFLLKNNHSDLEVIELKHILVTLYHILENCHSSLTETCIGDTVLQIFENLLSYLRNRYLPDYFIRNKNLFQPIPVERIRKAEIKMTSVVKNVLNFVFEARKRLDQSLHIAPDFEKLFLILNHQASETSIQLNPIFSEDASITHAEEEEEDGFWSFKNKNVLQEGYLKAKDTKKKGKKVESNEKLDKKKGQKNVIRKSISRSDVKKIIDFFLGHFLGMKQEKGISSKEMKVLSDHCDNLKKLLENFDSLKIHTFGKIPTGRR